MGATELRICDVGITTVSGGWRATATWLVDGERIAVWFEGEGPPPPHVAAVDAVMCAAAFPAMVRGARLHVEGDACPLLARNLVELGRIFSMWYSHLLPIEVSADGWSTRRPSERDRPGAMLFTCGIDSMETLVRRDATIGTLVNVARLETMGASNESDSALGALLTDAAAALGRRLFRVRTNLTDLQRIYVRWDQLHLAACIASSHLAAGHASSLHFPSSTTYTNLVPWASHPMTDPLWSSSGMRFVAEGAHLTRARKCAAIAARPELLRFLRVCSARVVERTNCGECEKCIRSQAAMRVAGIDPALGNFRRVLTLDEIARVELDAYTTVGFWEELLSDARAMGASPDLLRALRRAVRRNYRPPLVRWALAKPGRVVRRLIGTPDWRQPPEPAAGYLSGLRESVRKP